jgi:hypothetical protein
LADSALYKWTNSTIDGLTDFSIYKISDLAMYRLILHFADLQILQSIDCVIGRFTLYRLTNSSIYGFTNASIYKLYDYSTIYRLTDSST